MGKRMKYEKEYHYGEVHRRKRWMIISLVVVLVLFVLFSRMLFTITTITVKGNEKVSSEEIISEMGLQKDTNLIAWLLISYFSDPDLNPLISTVDVYIQWPNTVNLKVTERNIVGYVAWNGTYLCIDDAGYVVDSTHTLKEDMPVLTGVSIKNFTIGQPLNTNSKEISAAAVAICKGLDQYGLRNRIVRIDLTDLSAIKIYTERLEIRIGSDDDLTLKMKAIQLVLNETPEAAGILHMENVNGQVYLERVV